MNFYFSCLLLCRDVSLNPGPVKYLCGICDQSVKSNQRGIQCDYCDTWFHVNCINLNPIIYEALANTSCIWECDQCGFPNFSSSLLSSLSSLDSLQSSNSYSSLASLILNSQPNTGDQASSRRDNCSPVTPTPLASSYPAPAMRHKRKLQCMEINCGSIRSAGRAAIFAGLVNQYKPDIIFGCESQLNSTSSTFPLGYTIHRVDRLNRDGGRNFIAVISSIPSYVIEDRPR